MTTWRGRVDGRHYRRALIKGHRHATRPMPAASRIADKGLIWLWLAAALAVRHSTRRAAVAGLGTVAITTSATGLVHQVVKRDRPSGLTALLTRGPTQRPAASSFPSTHAANAFAFGTAVTLVNPRLGVLLVPLAAAASISRAGIGHHYPTDVAAGVLLGTGVGLGSSLLARRRASREAGDTAG